MHAADVHPAAAAARSLLSSAPQTERLPLCPSVFITNNPARLSGCWDFLSAEAQTQVQFILQLILS